MASTLQALLQAARAILGRMSERRTQVLASFPPEAPRKLDEAIEREARRRREELDKAERERTSSGRSERPNAPSPRSDGTPERINSPSREILAKRNATRAAET
jgi:hypothetical protein